MRVFKFGGASVKDADGIKNVCNIIQRFPEEKLVVIVSATGKTTNALEDVVKSYFSKDGNAKQILHSIRENHHNICKGLFADENHPVYAKMENYFVEVEWQLDEERMEAYNYVYDQIVSLGEMLSTIIVSAYLQETGSNNTWVDVRDYVKTDDTYREAKIDWELTPKLIKESIPALLEDGIVVTQGFIGCTPDNDTTTLGREGSDFTAAIFANALDAENQTIWKDVPGVLNGDPRLFEDAVLMEELSYGEAVEMTYYGAQVIHPKTIKPLQNKNIPLLVKSFIHPDSVGTKVFAPKHPIYYPPVRVIKKNQALITLHTKDFSFIEEYVLSKIIRAFSKVNIKLNMIQNAAILFQACVDDVPEKIEAVTKDLENYFNIQIENNLTLLTIRHYTPEVINKLTHNKSILIEQRRATTYQALLK
jgi:aspartate kinase